MLVTLAMGCHGVDAPVEDRDTVETGLTTTTMTTDTGTRPDTGTSATGSDFRPRVAAVAVRARDSASVSVAGYLYDGVLPWDYREVARDGPCRALFLGIPRCSPACVGGEFCVGEDQCAPYPRLLSAGRLDVDGVAGVSSIEPTNPPVYYASATSLPGPADVVTVTASGSPTGLGPFTLSTRGVEPLVLEGGIPPRNAGEDLVLRWTADPGARIRARFAVDYAHTLAPQVVECEGPDVGELVVAAALIDAVMESPDWSCGLCFGQRLERIRGDHTVVDGVTVDLEVVSEVGLPPRL